jgi:hypothetical protein
MGNTSLPLTLLVTRVFAHNATHALSHDDATIFATRFDRGTNFHRRERKAYAASTGGVGRFMLVSSERKR